MERLIAFSINLKEILQKLPIWIRETQQMHYIHIGIRSHVIPFKSNEAVHTFPFSANKLKQTFIEKKQNTSLSL